jgi:hypothetical protein
MRQPVASAMPRFAGETRAICERGLGVKEVRCDVLVVGGSLGGVAAALRAGEMGAQVVLIEESGWLGGQLTAQGVCTPDENRWIESGGGTASYRALRRRIRDHYKNRYRLSASGASQEHFNPGSCWVSRISVEPLVAAEMLSSMLSTLPNVRVELYTGVTEVELRINTIASLYTRGPDGADTRYLPAYVLDATELGDLLPLAGVEHVVGAESFSETGEPDAPPQAHPEWVQPFTFPFALELRPAGEDHTISPPPDYDELKALQNYHILDGAMRGMFGDLGWWTYRRVIAAENFDDPAYPCDVAMINTGSNDFKGGIVPTGDPVADASTLERARRASLAYVYWLQTECPRADDPSQRGYPELKLRGDLFGAPDGIAPAPYIRESRRIKARTTVLQQEVVAADSSGTKHQAGPRATFYPDSCGIGHYWLDIHEGGTPEPNRFMETQPFQIPVGSLVPVRVANLLAACKNLGVTHLTNGAYRLHPIEWNVGEAAGALAAFCVQRNVSPQLVHGEGPLLRRFQEALLDHGIPLYWWGDLPSEHPAFVAAQRLAMDGIWPGGEDVLFRPDEPMTDGLKQAVQPRLGRAVQWPAEPLSRGDAARWLLRQLS